MKMIPVSTAIRKTAKKRRIRRRRKSKNLNKRFIM